MRDYKEIERVLNEAVEDNNRNKGSIEMYKKYSVPSYCDGLFSKPKSTRKAVLLSGTWHIDNTDVLDTIAGFQLVGAYRLNKSKSKYQMMYDKMYVVYNPATDKVMYENNTSIYELLRYILISEVDGEDWAEFYSKEVSLK